MPYKRYIPRQRCKHCNKLFPVYRKGTMYCSSKCKVAAHRARKDANLAATQHNPAPYNDPSPWNVYIDTPVKEV